MSHSEILNYDAFFNRSRLPVVTHQSGWYCSYGFNQCQTKVEYRDFCFAKISQRKPHIEFFKGFIFVTLGAIFKNERCVYACLLNIYAEESLKFITYDF